jgi:hypothetical protein
LANAVMYSYWCGYQSERLKKDQGLNFRDEWVYTANSRCNKQGL